MKQISLSKDFSVSPIIHGQMQCAAHHKSDRGVALLFGTILNRKPSWLRRI